MSKKTSIQAAGAATYRCPRCDTVVPDGAEKCLMCGLPRALAPQPVVEPPLVEQPIVAQPMVAQPGASEPPAPPAVDEVISTEFTSMVRESRSSLLFWVVAAAVVVSLGFGWLALRDQAPTVMAAFIPTTTPLPPTITATPTWTPLPE